MEDKIVLLCSGGFDSIVLAHKVRDEHPLSEVHSLTFDYGQLTKEQELHCAKKVSDKLDFKHHIVTIPKISWSNNSFYSDSQGKSHSDQYLEYRNLIFISYALSLAESIGAKFIYLAILKSHGYTDTSPLFLKSVNGLSVSCSDIQVIAPFKDLDKCLLAPLAYEYNIQPDEYWSCDMPKNNKPCGKCDDCKNLNIIEEYIKPSAIKRFSQCYNTDDEEFCNLIKSTPFPHELRVLINNECQLKCSHCFYGFEKMKQPRLSRDELLNTIGKFISYGVSSLHFGGKEPLVNDYIFNISDFLKTFYPEVKLSVVTNGINVPKYANYLKRYGFTVMLSVDTLIKSGVRDKSKVSIKDALNALKKYKIDTEVFIDLHHQNKKSVHKIIKQIYKNFGVTKFHVRTIRRIGSAKNFEKLSVDDLERVVSDIVNICFDYPQVFVSTNIGVDYTYDLIGQSPLGDTILKLASRGTDFFLKNLQLYSELYCAKYTNVVTLTPDGYLLGCGSEVANPNYDEISVGNVRDCDIPTLISKGRDKCILANKGQCVNCKVDFKNCRFNV